MTPVRPVFQRPPVVEQVFTVMFAPIENFSLGHIGLFWRELQNDFPICNGEEPLPPIEENFNPFPTFRFQMMATPPLPRAMLRNPETGAMVQVQNDRFSFNWMKVDGAEYPRHHVTIARFWQLFSTFEKFLSKEGLAKPAITQCELTNVNIIPALDFGLTPASSFDALAVQLPKIAACPDLEFENAQMATHYLMKSPKGELTGRLHASIQSVRDANNADAVRFDLTARGRPEMQDQHGVEVFFDLARTAINGAFLGYTTAQARAKWGESVQ